MLQVLVVAAHMQRAELAQGSEADRHASWESARARFASHPKSPQLDFVAVRAPLDPSDPIPQPGANTVSDSPNVPGFRVCPIYDNLSTS